MDDLYLDHILDHAENPRGKTRLDNPTCSIDYTNTSCGDTFSIDLLIKDGSIVAVGWAGDGCAVSQAAASLLSEKLVGITEHELRSLTDDQVLEMLSLPEISFVRRKCALSFFWGAQSSLRVPPSSENSEEGDTLNKVTSGGWHP